MYYVNVYARTGCREKIETIGPFESVQDVATWLAKNHYCYCSVINEWYKERPAPEHNIYCRITPHIREHRLLEFFWETPWGIEIRNKMLAQ